MASTTVISINGRECSFEQPQVRVSELLNAVDTSTDQSVLVSSDGVKHDDPNELIDIVSGEIFVTEDCGDFAETDGQAISFTVNGETCTTTENHISVETIFRTAGPGAAIDLADIENYYLQNTSSGAKYEDLEVTVEICSGDNFIAIHVGRTPVASVSC